MEVDAYAVHQNGWPLLLGLGLGWAVILVGTFHWGMRFLLVALPLGLLIPASRFLQRPGLWRGLLDPEVAAWNAGYWLIPACGIAGLALLMRRSRQQRQGWKSDPGAPSSRTPLSKLMSVAPAHGAVFFGNVDPKALEAKVCTALTATVRSREFLIWQERVDLTCPQGNLVLLHDEDGSSYLELSQLPIAARDAVVQQLLTAGFGD